MYCLNNTLNQHENRNIVVPLCQALDTIDDLEFSTLFHYNDMVYGTILINTIHLIISTVLGTVL